MSRFKLLSFSVAALMMSACGAQAESAERTPVSNVETEAASDYWTVMPDESHLKFSAKQEGEDFAGIFENFDAKIIFDPENLSSSSVVVTVPLMDVDAGSKDRNSTLPNKAWFFTKKFPDAVFISSDISKLSGGEYLAKGSLTLKGLEKSLELPFTLEVEGGRAVMRANVEIDRTKWNVGEDPWNTNEWISQAVNLDILLTATKP